MVTSAGVAAQPGGRSVLVVDMIVGGMIAPCGTAPGGRSAVDLMRLHEILWGCGSGGPDSSSTTEPSSDQI
jgi:hypothetical protein